jgi:Tfp pilus assembly protein PilV
MNLKPHIKKEWRTRHATRGFMLIEVLVSILLFALGIVALIGLQANSLGTTSDAGVRAEAVRLASSYVGEMWASGLQGSDIEEGFGEDSDPYDAFSGRVAAAIPTASSPTITLVDDSISNAAGTLTNTSVDVWVTIQWTDVTGTTRTHSHFTSLGYPNAPGGII